MDKVAKGMSEAGREAAGCGAKPEKKAENLREKVKGMAKDAAQKVGEGLKATGRKIKDAAR